MPRDHIADIRGGSSSNIDTIATPPQNDYDDQIASNFVHQIDYNNLPPIVIPDLNLNLGNLIGSGTLDFSGLNFGSLISGFTIPTINQNVNPNIPTLATNPIVNVPNNPFLNPTNTNDNPTFVNIPPVNIPVNTQTIITPVVNNPSSLNLFLKVKIVNKAGNGIDGVQIFVNQRLLSTTDASGIVTLENITKDTILDIKAKGFVDKSIKAGEVPNTIVLTANAITKFPIWYWILGGVVIFGGYKYFFDKKSSKVIRAEI